MRRTQAPQAREQKKRSLLEVCKDLKQEKLQQELDKRRAADEAQAEVEQQQLWIQLYGPIIDPWAGMVGSWPRDRFDSELERIWSLHQNRLPLRLKSVADLLQEGISSGVVQVEDGFVRVLPRAA